MPFRVEHKEIEDVLVIAPKSFSDERGYFKETFKESDFRSVGIKHNFKQDNESYSKKGVLRGLHYQLDPVSQGKLVRVVQGSVFDVAVDLRRDSVTYGKWVSETLSAENQLILWIPPGFAHGFLATEDSILVYKATNEYSRLHERGIIWNDTHLSIEWPWKSPVVIDRDLEFPSFKEADMNF